MGILDVMSGIPFFISFFKTYIIMKIRKAERKQSKIRVGLSGVAGSGKSYSALLLAQGLVSDLSRVVVVDTESGSSDLYSHLGPYEVIQLDEPFSPERYIQAIDLAESTNVRCIIIDSLSHSWEYLLQYHSKLTGNSFTNWGLVKPRMKALINKILNCNAHIICTMRTKTDYILTENSKGKIAPQKVGLKSIQIDGIDYEHTIMFELDINNVAICTKDRTQLFSANDPFKITASTGKEILDWCNSGTTIEEVKAKILAASNLQDLTDIYNAYKSFYSLLEKDFQLRRKQLNQPILNNSKPNSNGIYKH